MKTGYTVYLIGFMASGKSRVGRLLAGRLGYGFADIDEMVEREEGMPIWKIFRDRGERRFRALESHALRKLADLHPSGRVVVATGGGLPCDPENLSLMKSSGVVVYLRVGVQDILRRAGGGESRPVFRRLSENGDTAGGVRRLLEERERSYTQADLTVPNGDETKPEETAERIVRELERLRP
jgi:shikimate kinase